MSYQLKVYPWEIGPFRYQLYFLPVPNLFSANDILYPCPTSSNSTPESVAPSDINCISYLYQIFSWLMISYIPVLPAHTHPWECSSFRYQLYFLPVPNLFLANDSLYPCPTSSNSTPESVAPSDINCISYLYQIFSWLMISYIPAYQLKLYPWECGPFRYKLYFLPVPNLFLANDIIYPCPTSSNSTPESVAPSDISCISYLSQIFSWLMISYILVLPAQTLPLRV